MRKYTPRRASKRWLDSDCPAGVLDIFDSKGPGERYTVFYAAPVTGTTFAGMWLGYRGMDTNPFHPQGIGIYGEMKAHEAASYRYRQKHRRATWSSLPDAVKRCVIQDLSEES